MVHGWAKMIVALPFGFPADVGACGYESDAALGPQTS